MIGGARSPGAEVEMNCPKCQAAMEKVEFSRIEVSVG